MTYVSKEVPSGTVDGTNKVFTWLNAPTQFDDLWVDGAIYTSFTLVGKVMTLADAPQYAIFGDYYFGPQEIEAVSNTTFGEVKAEVWALLGQRSTSTTFSDPRVGKYVNATVREVLRGRVRSMLDPNRTFRCGKIWFMEGDQNIRVKSGSILTADFAIGDVTIDCDTANLLPAGYVDIGGDTFKYTGTTATQLLGVTGGTCEHKATEKVDQLYQLPLDAEKPNEVLHVVPDAYMGATTIRTSEIPLDNSGTFTIFYQIRRLTSPTPVVLLRIAGITSEDIVTAKYTNRFDDMTADSDQVPLPGDYGLTVVAPLVAGLLAFQKSMPIASAILVDGYSKLQAMYGDFGNEVTITRQLIKPIPYGKK